MNVMRIVVTKERVVVLIKLDVEGTARGYPPTPPPPLAPGLHNNICHAACRLGGERLRYNTCATGDVVVSTVKQLPAESTNSWKGCSTRFDFPVPS